MRRFAMMLALAALAGCERDRGGDLVGGAELTSAAASAPVGERDTRGEREADERSSDPADVEVAAALRAGIDADDTLSSTAKDIVIAASADRIVLRGAVMSQRERETLTRKARELAGSRKVDDKLAVQSTR